MVAKSNTKQTETKIVTETEVKTVTPEQQLALDIAYAKSLLEANGNNKSAVIRLLSKEWADKRGRIAKAMDIKYQFVRNVLEQKSSKKSETKVETKAE